jgi:hypothetical protein
VQAIQYDHLFGLYEKQPRTTAAPTIQPTTPSPAGGRYDRRCGLIRVQMVHGGAQGKLWATDERCARFQRGAAGANGATGASRKNTLAPSAPRERPAAMALDGARPSGTSRACWAYRGFGPAGAIPASSLTIVAPSGNHHPHSHAAHAERPHLYLYVVSQTAPPIL